MNQLAVAISIVLFPGLIACVICDKIIVHAQRWDAFKYAIYSFVFGLLSFTLLQAIVFIIDGRGYTLLGVDGLQRGSLSVWTMIEVEKYKINLVEVVWATLLAPLIAALAATTVNFKIINLISQKIGISRKYGDENLFSFFLDSPNVKWVYVRAREDNLTYLGRVASYAEYSSTQEILLEDVEVFDYESSERLYGVASAYLAKPVGGFIIELVNPVEEEESNGEEDSQ